MKTNIRIFLIIFIAALLVFAVVKIAGKPGNRKDKSKEKNGPKAVSVDAFVAKQGYFENQISLTGTLLANENIELKAEASGKIQLINFIEGTTVRKGQLLLKINDDDLKAQLKKLNLQVELAVKEESRKKKLLEINGISQEEYDLAQNNLNTLKAEAELMQAQIEKTQVVAPFDGLVGLRNVSIGSFINSSTVIASLQMTDPIKIEFSVPERYMTAVKTGTEIIFTIEGKNKNYNAKVFAFEPKIDMNSGTAKVRAVCRNTDGLIPGSFVNVQLILNKSDNTIQIPTQAVVPQLKGQFVYICQNGKAKSVKVETGNRTDSSIEIKKGIMAGDSVITSGLLQIKQGTMLKIRKVK